VSCSLCEYLYIAENKLHCQLLRATDRFGHSKTPEKDDLCPGRTALILGDLWYYSAVARRKFNPNQKLFIKQYLIDRNATNAAIRAGYSPRTAYSIGSELLKKPDIRFAINKKLEKYTENVELKAKTVLSGLADAAYHDPRNLFDEKGNMKEIPDLDERSAKCIAGFETVNLYEGEGEQKHVFGQLKKVKLADRLKALEMLGKHLQLFPTNVNVAGPGGGPLQLEMKVMVLHGNLNDYEGGE